MSFGTILCQYLARFYRQERDVYQYYVVPTFNLDLGDKKGDDYQYCTVPIFGQDFRGKKGVVYQNYTVPIFSLGFRI